MNQNIFENPFTQCTARDMSYEEVISYWCDPFNLYKIEEIELLNSKTPIFIEGERGSGKTMILKYISYYCQKELIEQNNGTDLINYFSNKGSIGIYLRYKEDFVNMFSSLTSSEETKKQLFTYYYELLILRETLQIIDDLIKNSNTTINEIMCSNLYQDFNNLFNENFNDICEVISHVNTELSNLDKWVRNSRYIENAEDILTKQIIINVFSSSINIIKNSLPLLKDTMFLIIIDEYENAKEYQQNLNSYIKKVDHNENISYRIGMRIEGIYTYDTSLGEPLQVNRDFLLKKLYFQHNHIFKNFLKTVCEKRLSKNTFFNSYQITDISDLLGKSENVENEIIQAIRNTHTSKLKHFDLLEQNVDKETYALALEKLRCENNPLLEMLNIIWILRGSSVDETSTQMNKYLSGNLDKSSKYRRDYIDKYKIQLAFILLNLYKKKKLYYSFNTFSFLATYSVNDFISLCRNTFYQLDSNYFENIKHNPIIPATLQTNGAIKTALEQLGKIKANDENGLQMYTYIMNLGNWFSLFHKDTHAKYPETTQFAFENDADIYSTEPLNKCLKSMLKWGVLIKKPEIQSISIGRRKGTIYFLNHIFAPLFNISYRIRGGYNPILPTSLFSDMLSKSMEPNEIEKNISNLKKDKNPPRKLHGLMQVSLFEEKHQND